MEKEQAAKAAITARPPAPPGYRPLFNMTKEDLLLELAEWMLDHADAGPRKRRVRNLLDRIKFIRAKLWIDKRPVLKEIEKIDIQFESDKNIKKEEGCNGPADTPGPGPS